MHTYRAHCKAAYSTHTLGNACKGFDFDRMGGQCPHPILPMTSAATVGQSPPSPSSLLVEAPVGVGFSYSLTKSEYVTNDTKTASDNFIFVQKWLEAFPEYKSNELYIT